MAGMNEIQLGKQWVKYTVRESKRARRVRLKIDYNEGLEVIIPAGFYIDDMDALLRRHEPWILKHLDKMENMLPQRQYVSGETIPYLGQDYTLQLIPNANKSRVTCRLHQKQIQIKLAQGLNDSEHTETIKAALEAWYRKKAKAYIGQRAAELAATHGFIYKKITIRNQKTRWGSCSSLGNLNFNWRLMMTPPAAIDYLIIHELCHLRELNHSKRFWNLVAALCPDYAYWRKWLKDNSALLQL